MKPITAAESVEVPVGLLKDVKKVRGPVEQTLEKTAANIFEYPDEKKYLGNICTQNGCPHKKIIFYFFSRQVKTAKKV